MDVREVQTEVAVQFPKAAHALHKAFLPKVGLFGVREVFVVVFAFVLSCFFLSISLLVLLLLFCVWEWKSKEFTNLSSMRQAVRVTSAWCDIARKGGP